jgi:MoaA/NifB/PqqE/SkfB family radical SAM enzyme
MLTEPGVDFEVTNRCNATCHFCPRDATPHQGLMTEAIFEQSLARTLELRDALRERMDVELTRVSLCGLGEPLLNRHVIDWARRVTDAGLKATMSSNGSLLDERRSAALLEAGLAQILINVGDTGDDYEQVYGLPWEKTRDRVTRFVEQAGDRCEVFIVLVDHRQDAAHLAEMRAFWGDIGVTRFVEFDVMNRGGALFVDHMQYEAFPERAEARELFDRSGDEPYCAVPFSGPFIGYDGRYYLCCSDWKKEVPLGSVFDRSLTDILVDKLVHVRRRSSVCQTCNLDPLNQFTDQLRALGPDVDDEAKATLLGSYLETNALVSGLLERLQPGIGAAATAQMGPTRPRIPVTSA